MNKWEYKIQEIAMANSILRGPHFPPEDLALSLNEAGQQGWELVDSMGPQVGSRSFDSVILIFKRPI